VTCERKGDTKRIAAREQAKVAALGTELGEKAEPSWRGLARVAGLAGFGGLDSDRAAAELLAETTSAARLTDDGIGQLRADRQSGHACVEVSLVPQELWRFTAAGACSSACRSRSALRVNWLWWCGDSGKPRNISSCSV
jgi:hypothetical protein